MPTILGASTSGMAHMQTALDVVAHNLANLDTAGFKKYRAIHEGVPDPLATPEGGRLGIGQTTTDLVFSPASLMVTESPLNFAIEDDSFLRVTDYDGETLYTRYGGLDVDVNGTLLAFGARPVPDIETGEPITVPELWTQVAIDPSGTVSAVNLEGERVDIGQVAMVKFTNAQGLEVAGEGYYRPGPNAGDILIGPAASEGFAALRPGALESSNVDMAEEITNMLIAQRTYSACAKTFAVGDEMLAIATRITQ